MSNEIPVYATKEHIERVRETMENKLTIFSDDLHSSLDPSTVSPHTLFEIMRLETRLNMEYPAADLKPFQNVTIIDRVVRWYEEKGVQTPHKEWINECRDYWISKTSD